MCDTIDLNLEQAPTVFPGEGGSVRVQSHTRAHVPHSPGTWEDGRGRGRAGASVVLSDLPGQSGLDQHRCRGECGDVRAGIGRKQLVFQPHPICRQTSCFAIRPPPPRPPREVDACEHVHGHMHTHQRTSSRPFLPTPPPGNRSGTGNKSQVLTKGALAPPWRMNDFYGRGNSEPEQNKTKVLFGLSSPGYAHCSVGQAVLMSTWAIEWKLYPTNLCRYSCHIKINVLSGGEAKSLCPLPLV